MKEIKLYYVDSELFGETLMPNVSDLDEAKSVLLYEYANDGDVKLIERVYDLKEEKEYIIDTNY